MGEEGGRGGGGGGVAFAVTAPDTAFSAFSCCLNLIVS